MLQPCRGMGKNPSPEAEMPVDASRLQIAPTSTRAHFDIESWQALRRGLGFEAGGERRQGGGLYQSIVPPSELGAGAADRQSRLQCGSEVFPCSRPLSPGDLL